MLASQERELSPLFSDHDEEHTTHFLRSLDPERQSLQASCLTPFESITSSSRSPSATLTQSSSQTLATASENPIVAYCTLLDLPSEIRIQIYNYLIFDPSIEHCLAHRHLDVFKVTSIAHICQAIREEYLAYLLSRFAFKTSLDWLPQFVSTFGKLLYITKISLVIFYDPSVADEPIDLLPLLELEAKMPNLFLRFELPASSDSQLPFDTTLTEDFNHLLATCHDNAKLVGYIQDCMMSSLVFHSKDYLQRRYPNSRLNARIQIRFKYDYKQLWMDGTHSLDELQHFLSATGLNAIVSLDVWVGIASMSAGGKGLRTRDQLQELAQLVSRDGPCVL